MAYKPHSYQSKNVYLPKELYKLAELRAAELYMNFTVYVRNLIVSDLEKSKNKGRIPLD